MIDNQALGRITMKRTSFLSTLCLLSLIEVPFVALQAADKPKPEYPMPPVVKPSRQTNIYGGVS